MPAHTPVYVVSCSPQQNPGWHQPKDLYDASRATWFREGRRAAQALQGAHGGTWLILSTRYGLLVPDGSPVHSYDTSRFEVTRDDVSDQIRALGLRGAKLTTFLGASHQDLLAKAIGSMNVTDGCAGAGGRITELAGKIASDPAAYGHLIPR